MSYTTPAYQENYKRPATAMGFTSYGRVKVGSVNQPNERVPFVLPTSDKIGKAEFAHFAEVAVSKGNKPLVICSGYPFLFGTATGGDKLGILTKDAVPSERVTLDVDGTFYMPYDYLGDAGATPARVAATINSDLSGRSAFWMPTLGLITDKKPAGSGQIHLEVGYFIDSPEPKPDGIDAGIYWAKVKLTSINQAAIAYPSVTPSAAANLIDAFASVNFEAGDKFTVDLFADAFFNNPNFTVADSEISWRIAAGIPILGRHINFTGAAGTHAVTLDITSNGVTMTRKTFDLVLSATNAPRLTAT